MAETTYGQWALTTNKNQGSRLTNLTSGTGVDPNITIPESRTLL